MKYRSNEIPSDMNEIEMKSIQSNPIQYNTI